MTHEEYKKELLSLQEQIAKLMNDSDFMPELWSLYNCVRNVIDVVDTRHSCSSIAVVNKAHTTYPDYIDEIKLEQTTINYSKLINDVTKAKTKFIKEYKKNIK